PDLRVSTMRFATRLMLSASATDEPPYFCTISATEELLREGMVPATARGLMLYCRGPFCASCRVLRHRRWRRTPEVAQDARGGQTARRPSNARPSVTSSAYSRSPPTGRPEA